MAVSLTRVVDGHIETFLLDFIKLTDWHTGAYMADRMYDMMEFYGILERVRNFVLILHI